jgi:hypothetical protein
MSKETTEWLEVVAKILPRCWILGFLLMRFSFVVFMLTGEVIYDIHGKMFGLSPHELDLLMHGGLGLFKLAIIRFFLLPWLSIRMVANRAQQAFQGRSQ